MSDPVISKLSESGLAVCFSFAIILSTYASAEVGRVAFAQESRNGPIFVVEIGGNTLRVPEKYFLGTKPKSRETPGIYIRALMPDMDPMREDNKEQFLYAKGFGRTVGVAIGDAKSRTSLQFRLEATRKSGAPYAQREDQYGLHVYMPVEPETASKGTFRQELYVAEDHAKLSVFIACYSSVPSPGCRQEFLYRDFLIDVSFNKRHLPEWRAIKKEVIDLIDRFSQPS